MQELGIYIHVPFCRSRCEYCDFYSIRGGRNDALMDGFLQAVLLHIRETAPRAAGYHVDTIYFGGGTPSFFGASGLKRILAELDHRFPLDRQAEITFEANPDSVTPRMLHALRRAGFNRISIGIQSDLDEQLGALGRPHNFAQARQAVRNARSAGFDNLSVDLMYGLPNQSREQWMQTLRRIVDLEPDHISCYGLKVEPGTPLYAYRACANLPDDDMQADMYLYAAETLDSFGYRQYEISNFAREGFESRHNLKYWLGGEYLGFGPAAASDFAGKRFTCAADLSTYVDGVAHGGAILSECETIPLHERAGEYLMLRLRTRYGVNGREFTKRYRVPFGPLEKQFLQYESVGLAMEEDAHWRLTPRGFLVSNQIISTLLEIMEGDRPMQKKIL